MRWPKFIRSAATEGRAKIGTTDPRLRFDSPRRSRACQRAQAPANCQVTEGPRGRTSCIVQRQVKVPAVSYAQTNQARAVNKRKHSNSNQTKQAQRETRRNRDVAERHRSTELHAKAAPNQRKPRTEVTVTCPSIEKQGSKRGRFSAHTNGFSAHTNCTQHKSQ